MSSAIIHTEMPEQILDLNFHGVGRPIGRDFGTGEREFWVTRETFEAALDSTPAWAVMA